MRSSLVAVVTLSLLLGAPARAAAPAAPAKAAPTTAAPAAAPKVAPPAKLPEGWSWFTSEDGTFGAAFPAEPEHHAEAGEGVRFQGLTLRGVEMRALAMVVRADPAGDASGFEREADQFMNELADGKKVDREGPATVSGVSGREVVLREGEETMTLRYARGKGVLYVLAFGGKGSAAQFLDSFRALP